MNSSFSTLDWAIFGSYFLLVILSTVWLSRIKVKSSKDYFVGEKSIPMFAVAISVLATSQSAATFLGAPDLAYKDNLTFIGFFFSALLAVVIVSKVLVPRFYEIGAITVYELLEKRYSPRAKRDAGAMFLVGRLFASGARLYIGALAVSMILFSDIAPLHIILAIVILMAGSLGYAYFGGIKSIIYADIVQVIIYIGAALFIIYHLYFTLLGGDFNLIFSTLAQDEKLKIVDFTLTGSYNFWALITGLLLLNIAAYGLDQDMTQRILTCKDKNEGARSLMVSILITIPTSFLFLIIGLLLYLYYGHPEISNFAGKVNQEFAGEKIAIFMTYILHELPDGVKALATIGVVATTFTSTSSVLGAMSSVAVTDIYKPKFQGKSEEHYLHASKMGVLLFAILLSLMAILSYYWQRLSDIPLLDFALGVMVFAYAGLFGVFGVALFTTRGNETTVRVALIGGFLTVLLLQPAITKALWNFDINFSLQIIIGTIISFGIMLMGKQNER
ncbi:MAG: sodium:solute symporter [Epsilonproteobacteria bacterium]|nr:sodium:solute symporter [Campylobacterota bacterium]